MHNIFFTPGPSQIYPTVPSHINKFLSNNLGSISHRSDIYKKIHKHTVEQLQLAFDIPKDFTVFFGGSATYFWQVLIQNLVEKTSFHLVNGTFSKNFYDTAVQLNKNALKYEVKLGEGFDTDQIIVPDEAEIITVMINESSTGAYTSVDEANKLKLRYPDKLVLLDVVSTLPYPIFDWGLADCIYFSVQKGMGLPAGLGVCIVNQKCIDKSIELDQKGLSTGSYLSFKRAYKQAQEFQTPETPNIMGIYLLGKVLEDMNNIGINKIREETTQKAKIMYDYLATSQTFSTFVDPKWQSPTVVTVVCQKDPKTIIAKLQESELNIGTGYGKFKETQVRIALFPATTIKDVENLIEKMKELE